MFSGYKFYLINKINKKDSTFYGMKYHKLSHTNIHSRNTNQPKLFVTNNFKSVVASKKLKINYTFCLSKNIRIFRWCLNFLRLCYKSKYCIGLKSSFYKNSGSYLFFPTILKLYTFYLQFCAQLHRDHKIRIISIDQILRNDVFHLPTAPCSIFNFLPIDYIIEGVSLESPGQFPKILSFQSNQPFEFFFFNQKVWPKYNYILFTQICFDI